jgi:hypothetical protein
MKRQPKISIIKPLTLSYEVTKPVQGQKNDREWFGMVEWLGGGGDWVSINGFGILASSPPHLSLSLGGGGGGRVPTGKRGTSHVGRETSTDFQAKVDTNKYLFCPPVHSPPNLS